MTTLADNYLLKLSPVDGVGTVDDAIKKITDQVQNGTLLGGKWVAGYGYDPSRVQGNA